jgi:hypothetical protein
VDYIADIVLAGGFGSPGDLPNLLAIAFTVPHRRNRRGWSPGTRLGHSDFAGAIVTGTGLVPIPEFHWS